MYLAYIDEIGEPGAFVSRDDKRYNTSAAFGYAGFVLPDGNARHFGAKFQHEKNQLWSTNVARADHPGRWEKKGSEIFRPETPGRYPEQLRVFDSLVRTVQGFGGHLFYYAVEKPIGTPKQTHLDVVARESLAMRETLNRLARHVERLDGSDNLMVIIDQITEKTRKERLREMYAHILGRGAEYPEMRLIVEPPMHVDSQLSANVQFADWIAAACGRAIDYQLIADSRHRWITQHKTLPSIGGKFTGQSKLHLLSSRSVEHFNHSEIFRQQRRIHPQPQGQLVGNAVDPKIYRAMQAAADRAKHGK
ncbi:DUF3800 domain-containing protein [Demequina aurantiaca]|uniref:DUF3800 domain-containing protein n=1 Tax=Demequina aurantiaca TaxID=676200 RepID=UPI003D3496B7